MKRKSAVFAVLALIAGCVLATTTASAGAAQSGFPIVSRHSWKCLTVSDHNTGNGAGVLMVDCLGQSNQLWRWDGLNLRNIHTDRCLTAAWGNGENGAALHMWDCHGWYAQMFYRPASHDYEVGRIRSMQGGNRCVEIAGANPYQGASVQLWDCHTGANHYWNAP